MCRGGNGENGRNVSSFFAMWIYELHTFYSGHKKRKGGKIAKQEEWNGLYVFLLQLNDIIALFTFLSAFRCVFIIFFGGDNEWIPFLQKNVEGRYFGGKVGGNE